MARRGEPSSSMGRREFLRRAIAAGAAIPASAALAACNRAPRGRRIAAASAVPRTWPIFEDNPQIESGLPIERGATLRVYEWRDYLAADVLDAFERRYRAHDVRVQVESFLHMDEAIARLRRPGADFDIFFPTIDAIGELIGARLLRPLNHDYLPNLRNLWRDFRGSQHPFYDRGQRYTTPYTVYASGIGWRNDLVERRDAPDTTSSFDVLWNRRYSGRCGVYDSYREALSLALLRDGRPDVQHADASDLRAAGDALIELIRERGGALTLEGAYEGLPRGEFVAHQAWSGDLISAPRYGRSSREATAETLSFWRPTDGSGVVGCDLTSVCSLGRNPVLAHAFVNHLLDVGVAMNNFGWNGYQPPLEEASREAFANPSFRWSRIVPDNLLETILSPSEFRAGQMLLRLDPADGAMWIDEWAQVTAAARAEGTLEGEREPASTSSG